MVTLWQWIPSLMTALPKYLLCLSPDLSLHFTVFSKEVWVMSVHTVWSSEISYHGVCFEKEREVQNRGETVCDMEAWCKTTSIWLKVSERPEESSCSSLGVDWGWMRLIELLLLYLPFLWWSHIYLWNTVHTQFIPKLPSLRIISHQYLSLTELLGSIYQTQTHKLFTK